MKVTSDEAIYRAQDAATFMRCSGFSYRRDHYNGYVFTSLNSLTAEPAAESPTRNTNYAQGPNCSNTSRLDQVQQLETFQTAIIATLKLFIVTRGCQWR